MAGFDALVVGRKDQPVRSLVGAGRRRSRRQQGPAFDLGILEVAQQQGRVGVLEIVARIFLLGLQEDVAIGDLGRAAAAVEIELVDAVDPLHIHRQPLEPVGQLARHRRAFDAAHLLEIGELRHLHAVAPALPAKPPGAQRRALPIVLDEADVVQQRVDADRLQRAEIELLQVGRIGLQDHLVLVIMLQAIGVLAVAAILRTARGLHIGRLPAQRAQRPERRRGMKGAGTHLHVVGLQDDAAIGGPIVVQGQDQALERAARITAGNPCRRKIPLRKFAVGHQPASP